jgi:IstB-like ATP binding protein
LTRVDLLVIEDLGMRRLPPTAAEDLMEVFTRRYESGAILVSSNRPVEDWGQVLGDTAAAGALLDRFLHHAEIGTASETLTDYLRARSLLLVLDNCEHVVASCAALTDALLRACPGVQVVATSREPLGVAGETTWRVPSLGLPPPKPARRASFKRACAPH